MDSTHLRIDRHSLPQPHIFAAASSVSLEITRGRVRQRVRAVPGRVFLIGSAHDCDLVLGDLAFPEAYAYLFVDGPRVTVRRLGDGPPLLVCGAAVDTTELFHGDRLAFGPFELRLSIEDLPRHRADGERHVNDSNDEESFGAEVDSRHAIDEAQSLLQDIRRELAESAVDLRVYEALEESNAAACRRRAKA